EMCNEMTCPDCHHHWCDVCKKYLGPKSLSHWCRQYDGDSPCQDDDCLHCPRFTDDGAPTPIPGIPELPIKIFPEIEVGYAMREMHTTGKDNNIWWSNSRMAHKTASADLLANYHMLLHVDPLEMPTVKSFLKGTRDDAKDKTFDGLATKHKSK